MKTFKRSPHSLVPVALALAALALTLPAAAQTTTTTFVSGPGWNTTDTSGHFLGGAQYVVLNSRSPSVQPPGATNYGAPTSADWKADLSQIPGAYWIWAPGITGATPNASFAAYSFTQQFFLPGTPEAGTISVAVDDFAAVYVNGAFAGSTGSITDVAAAYKAQSALATFDLAPFLTTGQNTITIDAENGPASFAGSDPNPPYSENYAGVVFGGSLTSAAPVPEASTTVGFGLLLGLSCLTLAARRARFSRVLLH